MQHEKVFGILKKLTLDKSTRTIKSKYSNSITTKTIINSIPNRMIPNFKEFYFELNLYEMTLNYKLKSNDPQFKRSFGYKQILKYTLILTKEEQALSLGEYKLGFKLLFENKTFLLFCKTVNDLKIWIEAFTKFFEKKTLIINSHKDKLFKSKDIIKIKNYLENWKCVENFISTFSESFIIENLGKKYSNKPYKFNSIKYNFNEKLRIIKRRTNSSDKIYTRNKTTSTIKMIKLYNNTNNTNSIFYKSKLLKRIQNEKILNFEESLKIRKQSKFHKKISKNVITKINRKVDTNKFSFFLNLLFDVHRLKFRNILLSSMIKSFRNLNKAIKELKIIESISKMQMEMKNEWEFFMSEKIIDEKIGKENLKKEIKLIDNSKNKNHNQENNNDLSFDNFSLNISNHNHVKILNDTMEFKLELKNDNFNENIQKISDLDKDWEYEIKEYEEIQKLRDQMKNKNKKEITIIDEIEEEDLFVLEPDYDFSKKDFTHKFLNIFPKQNDKKGNSFSEEPFSIIDDNHFKPNYSIMIENDNIVKKDLENLAKTFIENIFEKIKYKNDLKINFRENLLNENINLTYSGIIGRKTFSHVSSPHFGNIAIIAQRFNKIDIMDDWKNYLNISK